MKERHESIVKVVWEENGEEQPILRTRFGLFFNWDNLI